MNYVRHLNAFFALVRSDQRLTSSHVSLYMALFQYWNFNRFHNPFSIYRDNIMQLSKIGSKNTYYKCIKELHAAKYIYYHPSVNKFHLVRISIIPLDVQPELPSRYKQLDLFSTENDTAPVPKEVLVSTNNDTVPVPKSVHILKPNSTKQKTVCNTPVDFLKDNGRRNEENNGSRRVPKSVHDTVQTTLRLSKGDDIPTLSAVEELFIKQNYPVDEAKKFFLYNQGKNWMLTDKMKIKDWQALAHKWMLNIKSKSKQVQAAVQTNTDLARDMQFLYESFLEGKKVFQHITTDHFQHLHLTLTDELIQQAYQQRTEQLSGSNQFSLGQLWQAYLKGNKENPLLIKDNPNLISLAKRIAVLRHFQQLQKDRIQTITIKTNDNEH